MGDKDRSQKEKLEFAGMADRARVAEYLNRLADGFRLGTVTLGTGGQKVRLETGEHLRLELEAQHRPDKGSASIQLEISWKVAAPAPEGRDGDLTIEPARSGSTPRTGSPVTERS